MTADNAASGSINLHRHLCRDALGFEQVGNLLLRTAHPFGQLRLGAVVGNRTFDECVELGHTSFLVEFYNGVN